VQLTLRRKKMFQRLRVIAHFLRQKLKCFSITHHTVIAASVALREVDLKCIDFLDAEVAEQDWRPIRCHTRPTIPISG